MLVVLESRVFGGLAEESGESLSFIFAEAAALLLDGPPVWEPTPSRLPRPRRRCVAMPLSGAPTSSGHVAFTPSMRSRRSSRRRAASLVDAVRNLKRQSSTLWSSMPRSAKLRTLISLATCPCPARHYTRKARSSNIRRAKRANSEISMKMVVAPRPLAHLPQHLLGELRRLDALARRAPPHAGGVVR